MPIGKRICMFVMNDVVSDGRVQRTARAAAAAGHHVWVLGLRSERAPASLEQQDGYVVARVDERSPLPQIGDVLQKDENTAASASEPAPHRTSASAPPSEPAPLPSRWKRWQALYDEHVTFAIRRNRIYQYLNTCDKRFRHAVRRALYQRQEDDLPPVIAAFDCRLRNVRLWERTSRHMADHDAIRRDVLVLGRRMVDVALAVKPDICHCNDLDTLPAGYWTKMRLSGRPRLVYDAHELWTEQHSPSAAREGHTDAWFELFDDLQVALAPHVDAVVTVNPSLALVLQSRLGCGPPTVVWNCSSFEEAPRMDGVLRKKAAGRKIVLMQGGLIPMDRGLHELIDAAPLLRDALLVFRGSGEARPALERHVAERGLEHHVCFVDPVPLARVVQSAAEADIGVIPYKPTSVNNLLCSPNKLFEYMMAGLALGVSDLPELRRVVVGTGAGVLFNPCVPEDIAACLNELLTDDARLERCRANSRRAAREIYNWEAQSTSLLALYS